MTNRALIPAVVICLTTSSLSLSSPLWAQQWQQLYKPVPNAMIPCRVMQPISLDSNVKYPVILSLHGAGGKGNDNRKQLKPWNMQLAQQNIRTRFPCYVVTPQADQLWNRDHYDAIKPIIAGLPQVDTDRIYILGHSMGGHGTYIFLQYEKDYFAAAAPSAGTGLRSSADFINPNKIKHYPIWAFHGDKDSVCPFAKQQILFNQLRKLGGNLKLTVWQGDNHGISAKFIPGAANGKTLYTSQRCDRETDFLVWLFKQNKTQQSATIRLKKSSSPGTR